MSDIGEPSVTPDRVRARRLHEEELRAYEQQGGALLNDSPEEEGLDPITPRKRSK